MNTSAATSPRNLIVRLQIAAADTERMHEAFKAKAEVLPSPSANERFDRRRKTLARFDELRQSFREAAAPLRAFYARNEAQVRKAAFALGQEVEAAPLPRVSPVMSVMVQPSVEELPVETNNRRVRG